MALEVDLGGVSVFIGIPVYGRIPPLTALSLARTLYACGAGGINTEVCMEQRGIVTVSRDQVLDSFLKSDKQKLFWIDSDMTWEPEAFFRMVALSTTRDIVCAAYPSKKEGPSEFQVSGTGKPETPDEYGLFQINGVGLGFTIMDRTVCESIVAGAPVVSDQVDGRSMAAVFRVDVINGTRRGEDMAFFSDLRDLGHQVWIDPTITLGHIGDKGWRGRLLDTHERNLDV